MRLSLIGPGDIEYHYQKLLKFSKEKFESELEKIAGVIADSKAEIEFLPDKGISFEVAKIYRKKGGRKIIGAFPKSDSVFGIKHLEPYLNEQFNGKPFFDEIIDTENWFKHDLIKGLLGNAILYLGSSPGTNGELNYAIYLYKLMSGNKKGIEVSGKYAHSEIRAGKNFTIFVYSPFLIGGKLKTEDEKYLQKFDIKLVYVKNPGQLKKELENFSKV